MYTQNLNCLTPPEKIFLPDGTELRLCVGAVALKGRAKLYCSSMGIFYSLSRRGLNPVKCRFIKNFRPKPNVHSYYPRMSGFRGAPYCHILIALTWIGPRPTSVASKQTMKAECHHLNGNICDNRASNLIWLTHEEHLRYDANLRAAMRRGINIAGNQD